MAVLNDTVSLLTPPGVGALAVVRLAGPGASALLGKHFSAMARESACVHGTLRDESGVTIDDPVVVVGPGGAFADVALHGSPWIVSRVIELAERAGFARDDEAWAVDDAAGDEIQREVLAALPLARTELALRMLLAQPEAWATLLANPTARSARRAIDDVAMENLLRVPRVAIVGIPNSGKSTLANQLFGSNRSITADMPGTTRDWVGEIADVDGLAVMLVDTPGIRQTSDPIERNAIELAGGEISNADLVVVVVDASKRYDGEQEAMVARFPEALIVMNKVDAPASGGAPVRVDVRTVATRGEGVAELRRSIVRRFTRDDVEIDVARCWTQRQREWLARFP